LIKGGFFSSSYVLYSILTKPLGYEVERRYSDFSWLRDILTREYPGIYVCPVSECRFHRCQRKLVRKASKKSF